MHPTAASAESADRSGSIGKAIRFNVSLPTFPWMTMNIATNDHE
jgi:hypothetical protein